ncbi:MAG TPA: MFS transporter [Dehalococcoidia bacterium]|nr:MFS transporter [Dehalococcoidia bacterium]
MTTEAVAAPAQPRADRYLIFGVLAISLLAFVMQFAMVSVSLADLIKDLNAPLRWGGWVLTIFMIGQVIAMPAAGRLSERLGARTVFAGGFGLFAAASLVAAVAPNIYVMILARAAQGLAGGGLMPSGMSMIAEAFAEGRQRAIGLFSSILPFGAVAGPGVGGLISEHLGWRWTFAFHVPVGLLVLIAAFTILPRGKRQGGQRVDFLGIAFLAIALSALIYALTELGLRDADPNMAVVAISLAVSAVTWAALARHELTTEAPLIDLDLLRRREFVAPNAISFFFGFCWVGAFSLLPLYVRSAYDMGPAASGALMAPRAGLMGLTSMAASMLILRTGYRKPIATGLFGLSLVLGLVSLGLHDPTILGVQVDTFWWLFGVVLLGGFFFGMANPSLQNASMDIAPDRIASIAGLRGMFQTVGGTMGISISVLVASRSETTAIGLQHAYRAYSLLMLFVPLFVLAIAETARTRATRTESARPAVPERPAMERAGGDGG